MNDNPEASGQPPRRSMPPDAILPTDPPKDPIAALMFNLFFVFVGYFVIGQWQKGLAVVVGFFLELSIYFGVAAATLGCGTCAIIPVSFAMHAFLAADCYLQAQVLKGGRPIGQWTFFSQYL